MKMKRIPLGKKFVHTRVYNGELRVEHAPVPAAPLREGIDWIEGSHRRDECGQALLAANALAQTESRNTLTVRIRGVPHSIEFADWAHDRQCQRYYEWT